MTDLRMSDLRATQQQISDYVRLGELAATDLIVATPQVSRETRLGIYTNAYIARLDEALRANFPKLHLTFGDDEFFELTRRYTQAHPSNNRSIRWFGHVLADYLLSDEDYAKVPMLADLARLEWSLTLAFDAADEIALTAAVLATLSDDQWACLRLGFHPSVSVLPLAWNAIAIWKALDAGQEPPPPEPASGTWVVWRNELSPHFRSLPADEGTLLQAMFAGKPFGVACEALLEWHSEEDAPGIAAAFLGSCLRDGWIVTLDATDA